MIQDYLYIAGTNGRGRGIFTRQAIPADTVIEISPVLVLSGTDRQLLDQTLLHDYIFEWGELKDRCCMALGYISMYNHTVPSICEYFMDYDDDMMFIKTVRDILAEEELTINYNGDSGNGAAVWFETR